MIKLELIDKYNWYQCTQLKVSEDQKKIFPFSVVYGMAECKYRDDLHELAVYNDEVPVGFLVWGFDSENNEYWIISILIDYKFQNNGYGTKAISEIIKKLKEKASCRCIYIGHRPENKKASRLYEKMGFIDTGRRENGEIIRCLKF